jgi:hypothetical protein
MWQAGPLELILPGFAVGSGLGGCVLSALGPLTFRCTCVVRRCASPIGITFP